MDQLAVKIKTLRTFTLIYLVTLLTAFYYIFTYFTSSSFLAQYTSNTVVALLYALSAVLNAAIFIYISPLLRRIGNYRMMLGFLVIQLLSLIGIAFAHDFLLIATLFIVSNSIYPVLLFGTDIFLENISVDSETGGIRGIALVSRNTAPVIVPLIVGFILATPEYWKTYAIAAVILLPIIYIIASNFKDFDDADYPKTTIFGALKSLTANKDLYDIMIDNFLLNFYYCWMSIYMPIYLYKVIGFSWLEIGAMFSIMLVPFILFQIPLGRLADKEIGEKEILISGFVIIAVSTIMIPYLSNANFFLWTLLLFVTRIGAAFIEVGAETYFFKKVDAHDVNYIASFRMLKSLPYLLVPVLAALSFTLVDFKYSFLILGLIMLLGLRYTFTLKDTL